MGWGEALLKPNTGKTGIRTRTIIIILVIAGLIGATVLALLRTGGGGSIGLGLGGGAPVVAVLRIDGELATGDSGAGSLLSAGTAGSDTIVAELEQARQDPAVKAIVLRINSPGGSPAAAQEIAEELADVHAAGKVLVTSMADVAASGAYWVAANTDHIMADAGTLTGSIGVIWELPNYQGLYDKLGIRYITFTSGPYKDMGSSSRPMTDEEKRIMQSMVDDMYSQFVDTVAAGRNMPRQKVLELADGRVFTGSQALKVGLVDSLGGLRKAIAKAAELAGVADNYTVQELGRPSPLEILLGQVRGLVDDLRAAARALSAGAVGGTLGGCGGNGGGALNAGNAGEVPK